MKAFWIALAVAALAGCGPDDGRYADRLLPLVPGARWDYRTNDADGAPGARVVRVRGADTVGDQPVLVLETEEDGERRRSFLRDGQLLFALREEREHDGAPPVVEQFDPGALRGVGSADVRPGETFRASWRGLDGAEVEATWKVESVDEPVVIDAGSFQAVRIRRTQSDGDDATLWYAPGVGLIRADGAEHVVLVGWSLP